MRCGGGAKCWPYRPQGTLGLGSRDCIPGWWSWPYRPESPGACFERGASGLRAFRGHGRASSARAFRIAHASRVLPWFSVFTVSDPRVFAFLVRLPAICVCRSLDVFCLIAVPARLRFRPCWASGTVGFRPVRPAPSAWHEMPGWAFPGLRRPARAALSTNSPCAGWYACAGTLRGGRAIRVGRDRGGRAPAPASRDAPMSTSIHALRATTRRVAGMGLRAGLTGRKGCWAGVPGLHPGLMELALQAGIAAGRATRPDTSPLTSNARQGARHLWRTMNTRGVDHEWRAVDVIRPVRPRYAAGATLAARARAITGRLISTACHFCFSAVMERTSRQLGGSPMALKFSGTLQKDC